MARHSATQVLRLAKHIPALALQGLHSSTWSAVVSASATLLGHHGSTLPSGSCQEAMARRFHAGFVMLGQGPGLGHAWAHCSGCHGWVFQDKLSSDTCRCGSRWKQADIAQASQAGSLRGKGQQFSSGAWYKSNTKEVLFGDFPVGEAKRKNRRANGNGKAEAVPPEAEQPVPELDQAQSLAAIKSALEQA